jgi:glutathione synthase/RimK-type ligase-like ATP-grasp enzyme
MSRIAILTPDRASEGYRSRWRAVFQQLEAPLRWRGLSVEDRAWKEATDLAEFDLVLPLLVWGYHQAGPQWQEAVGRWEREGVRLRNPSSVLRWNADKRYLGRLQEQGAPVTPTRYVDRLSESRLFEAAQSFGTDRLIAKPQVSASAWQTIRWYPGQSLDGGPEGPAMIQPYLPSIEEDGEISLIYCSGRFSHAIRKVPQPGDFRVQPEYDGIITSYEPAAEERAAAEDCLRSASEALLYARVDLVRDLAGKPVLMELELVEPDLYLGYHPEAGRFFAAAVEAEANRSGASLGINT